MKIKLDTGAFMPEYAHEQDAGMDLRSPVNAVVLPQDSAIIHTGIHVEIPHGYVGFLKSKSGLNVNHDITSEGVIDEGYTGSICVKLYNHGGARYHIKAGDKISQLVILYLRCPGYPTCRPGHHGLREWLKREAVHDAAD